MTAFKRVPGKRAILVSRDAHLREPPFAIELVGGEGQRPRFRVLSVGDDGQRKVLALRGCFEIPVEGVFEFGAERRVRLERDTVAGFRAFLTDGGASMTGSHIDMAAHMALLLADLYATADPELGADIPAGTLEQARLERELMARYRNADGG